MTVIAFPGHADAIAFPGHADAIAFPGHAEHWFPAAWPLPRWRSVARIGSARWRSVARISETVQQ